jgi:hypothetical protein
VATISIKERIMKILRAIVIVLAAALVLASCSSMAQGAVTGAIGALGSGGGGAAVTAGASSASVDFQSGEVLCSTATTKMIGEGFWVARVLTPASPATKNQAEVVWVHNGVKEWVNFVVNSRKATKADMVVGANVFVCEDWDKIDSDAYRKRGWDLRTITSTDSLYKGRVEVSGGSYVVDYIRIPTDPVH